MAVKKQKNRSWGIHVISYQIKENVLGYENRPQGCQIYPLIYDFEFEKPVIDLDCREAVYFNKQKYSQSQIITLEKLISNLFR